MTDQRKLKIFKQLFSIGIPFVWLINGLICKLLNLVPRHTQIVGVILGNQYARRITVAIGLAETLLAVWIIFGKWRKLTAVLQILLVLGMNIIEFVLVPGLLLWGSMNLIFALMFAALVYIHGFKIQAVAKA